MRANERSAQIEREDLKAPFAPPGFAVMTESAGRLIFSRFLPCLMISKTV